MSTNAIALTDLLLAERSSLVRFARRIVGSEPAAEDIAQSVWLKIQQIDDHPPIANHRAFLYRLTRNLAFDRAKVERTRTQLFAGAQDADAADETPLADRAMLDREAIAILQGAIGELPERCRQALVLRRLEGLSPVEIGERMGISRQMVARYVAQAVEHCMARLAERD
jgi:RNA polymerase sigma-70 factor (ECF subfamily)